MIERWKLIPGMDFTDVSNLGRVRRRMTLGRIEYLKILKTATDKRYVNLTVRGYSGARVLDRLVGEAFCKDYAPNLRAIYKNGDRSDVRAKNLKWVPVSQVTKAPRGNAKCTTKLNPESVKAIRASKAPRRDLAKKYGVSVTTIGYVKRLASWQHL